MAAMTKPASSEVSARRYNQLAEADAARFASVVLLLKAERLERGLSQRVIAERMGTQQSHVSEIEDLKDTQVSTLQRYARAIGVRAEITLVERYEPNLDE